MTNQRHVSTIALGISALFLAVTPALANGVKTSGYLDVQSRWTNGGTGFRGISVVDGGIGLAKEMDSGSAVVDIPFAYNSTTAGTFNLGGSKAQGYVHYKYKDGCSWRLGQWDTAFGLDANDNVDNLFSGSGLLKTATPTVHAGFQYAHVFSDTFDVAAFVAAPGNATQLAGGTNADFGLHMNMKMDKNSAKLGFMFNNDAVGTNMLIDLVASMPVGDMELGFEFLFSKPKVGSSGIGILLQDKLKMSDELSLGVRGEFGSKLTAYSAIVVAVGPSYAMTKDLNLKLDYSLNSVKAVSGGTSATGHGVALAAQYKM